MLFVVVIFIINWFINFFGIKLLICVVKIVILFLYKIIGIVENIMLIFRVVVNIIEINLLIIVFVNKIL